MTTRVDIGGFRGDWTGTWFSDYTKGPYSITSTDTKSGGRVPGWRKLIREARNATGPYSRSSTNVGLIRGTYKFSIKNPNQGNQLQYFTGTGVITNSGSGHPGAPVLPTNSLDTQARIAFLKKVRKTQRNFQTGVFLGELKETIHMIARPASALRRAVSTYSRAAKKAARRARTAKGVAKAISGTWLEHSYGWRPLFSDVDDGMKALAGLPPVIGEVISGYAEFRGETGRPGWNPTESGTRIELRFRDLAVTRVRYKGMVAYDNDNPAGEWHSNWGLTLSDFAPTAWELIPYSFLIDYFSNVGDVLDTASMGDVSLRWGFRSSYSSGIRIPISVTQKDQSYGSGSPWFYLPLNCSVHVPELSSISFSRTSISSVSVGISDITVKVPGVSDWRKWANIAALAVEKIL